MARIAKADVNRALDHVAKQLKIAGGEDGRISRSDVKKALPTLSLAEKKLADIFFKFVDHRDFKAGATVTATDINKAVAYAKASMVAKYDVNTNGLSKDEIAKMSITGQRAVDLARALKAAGAAAAAD